MGKINIIENGSITSVSGFKAAGVTAGFKKSGALDFAVVYSENKANFAGVFTSCTFAAAPVLVCKERTLKQPYAQLIVINSGNANACTGDNGLENAYLTCTKAAEKFNIAPEEVLVCSTGRIGVQMPMEKIQTGINLAHEALSNDAGNLASQAIMTTDTVPKSMAVSIDVGGKTITIGAMSKGAGMIDPKMTVPHATMICCITTDAKIDNNLLRKMLSKNADASFNRITIDGDMSTNDTAIIMANGNSNVEIIEDTTTAKEFEEALLFIMQQLAKKMVCDGEGATKFVEVKVNNANTKEDAKLCCEAVANSLLCKTAWFGNDPNWGRIVAALGYSGATFDPNKVDIYYNQTPVVLNGGDSGITEEELSKIVKESSFVININLNCGDANYWVWTCDVSYEYVKINADYHT